MFKVQLPTQANFWKNSIYFEETLGIFLKKTSDNFLKNFLFPLELTFIAEKRIHILIDSVLPLTLVSILLPNSTHCNFLVTCGNFRQMAHTHSGSDKMDSVDYDVLEMEICDVLDYVFGLRSFHPTLS